MIVTDPARATPLIPPAAVRAAGPPIAGPNPDPLTRTPPPRPWVGRSIMVRHAPDGTVTATSRGLAATARTEGAALEALTWLLRAAAEEDGETVEGMATLAPDRN